MLYLLYTFSAIINKIMTVQCEKRNDNSENNIKQNRTKTKIL